MDPQSKGTPYGKMTSVLSTDQAEGLGRCTDDDK